MDGWKAFEVALGGVVAILSWLAGRWSTDLETLKRTSVTREELDKHLLRMESAGQRKHDENQTHLDRIEKIIRENETRDSQTRHDIRDSVNAISLQIAALSAVAKDRAERERGRNRGDSTS